GWSGHGPSDEGADHLVISDSSITVASVTMSKLGLRDSSLFFSDPTTSAIYTLSLHDALPIWMRNIPLSSKATPPTSAAARPSPRSEEHTSELQSPYDLVCRLLLEKKKLYTTNRLKNRNPLLFRLDDTPRTHCRHLP